jgi:hypothetical protein
MWVLEVNMKKLLSLVFLVMLTSNAYAGLKAVTTSGTGGGSGTPGGSTTQVQYNNGGSFGGTSALTIGSTGASATTQYHTDVSNLIATDLFTQIGIGFNDTTLPINVAAVPNGVISDANSCTINPTVTLTVSSGTITAATPSGGTGCTVGDAYGVNQTNGSSGLLIITAVSSGVPTSMGVLSGGSGFTAASGVTLNAGTVAYANLVLSGALTQNLTLIAEGGSQELLSKRWRITNNTTGNYTVTVCQSIGPDSCGPGRTLVVPQGTLNTQSVYVQFDGYPGNVDLVTGITQGSQGGLGVPLNSLSGYLYANGTNIGTTALPVTSTTCSAGLTCTATGGANNGAVNIQTTAGVANGGTTVTTSSYTIASTDNASTLYVNYTGGTAAITLPAIGTTGFGAGWGINVVNLSSTTSVTVTSSTNINAGTTVTLPPNTQLFINGNTAGNAYQAYGSALLSTNNLFTLGAAGATNAAFTVDSTVASAVGGLYVTAGTAGGPAATITSVTNQGQGPSALALAITSKTATTNGAGGAISILSGAGGTGANTGGVLTLTAGAGGALTGSAGGSAALVGGAAGSTGNDTGGAVSVTSGAGTGTGASGTTLVTTGVPGTTGASASTTISTHAGGSTSGNSGNVILQTGTVTSGTRGVVSIVGDVQFGGVAPTISSCGGGSLASGGTDHKGQITGITAATACTITFSQTLGTGPACTFSDSAGTAVGISSISTSAVTTSMTALTGTLYYVCF